MANLSVLASDANNPEFLGAMNPDSLLHVRFYERALPNNYQTKLQGRPIFDNIVFIEIHTPGNQLNVIDRPKIANDERRFPMQWAHFKNTHSSDPAKQGTPLSQWPLLNIAQAEMLKAQNFLTVEQIAFASDEQIGHVGMIAGMQPTTLRDKAKVYLQVARDSAVASKKDEELQQTKAQLAALQEQVQALMASQAQAPAPQPIPPVPIVPPSTPPEELEQMHPAKRKYIMTQEHKAKLKAAREAAKKEKEAK